MIMKTRRNQKMIYISDENLDFYEAMEHKSEWINNEIRKLKNKDKVEDDKIKFEQHVLETRSLFDEG